MTIKAILTDIEGTTTDISFVHKVLFPYAYEQLPGFLRENAGREDVIAILDQARAELGQPEADLETLITAFLGWIDADKKVTALKTLQGLIWVQGYQSGDFKGHLYADAYENLKQWHQAGLELNIFSSGSVKAQKLLFGFSDFGDLTPLFSGYFDTTTGQKREAGSYAKIAAAMQVAAAEILFLSDVEAELDAAADAGMQTLLLARDEHPAQSAHRVVSSFDEISL